MALDVRENVPLAPFSTLGVGGPTRFFTTAATEDALREAVAWAREREQPLMILGGGSNVVVSDDGHPGLVVHLALRGIEAAAHDGRVAVTVSAGEPWDDVAAFAAARDLAGIECLSGIPGLTGATPIQNVGAYGQEVSDTLRHLDALDLQSGRSVRFAAAECELGYRMSRFKARDRGRYVVLRVSYALTPGGPPSVRYAELARALEERGAAAASIAEVREAVIALRRKKSMVLDPLDPNTRSVGSFFMNPLVSPDHLARVEAAAARVAPDQPMPRYPTADGRVKLSAAWLIERSGLHKGYVKGRVGLSSRHTLAIVNLGGATAAEVVALAREVRDRVRTTFAVTLEPEPVFVHLSMD